MKDNTLSKLGGTCSILSGVALIVVAVVYLLLPTEQQDACRCPEKFFASTAQAPTLYLVEYAVFGVASLLVIAAVLAISESVRSANEGWVRWTSVLAIIGWVVNAIDSFRHVALDPERAAAYVNGDAAVKAALTVPGALQGLDPQGFLRWGSFGVWVLVVSLLGQRSGTWPRLVNYAGISVAIGSWVVVVGQVLQNQLLIAIAGGITGVVLLPFWTIWLGLRLRRLD